VRILHVISGLASGGAELFLERLLGELDDDEFQHAVVSLTGGGSIVERLRWRDVPVHELKVVGLAAALGLPWRLTHLIRDWQPDLIQGWLYHGNLAASCGEWIARSRTPVLWNIRHSLDQWSGEPLGLRTEIRIGGWVSFLPRKIIFNSSRSAIQHERMGYPNRKACIIPNGFDLEKFSANPMNRNRIRENLGLGNNDPVIGMLGRFHPLKDHENLLRAMRIVIDMEPRARLLMAGRSISRDNAVLMKLVNELRLDKNVILLGEREDVPELMNALDIYVSASSSEGFPNAVAEAMSCEVPCVVTDVGDSADLVGETGTLVPAKHPDALAQGILRMIRSGNTERCRLGRAARTRIAENYSNEKIADQYRELYRDVLQKNSSGKNELNY
jgi:glycosyltransferase involved in cell wall biosynthesis